MRLGKNGWTASTVRFSDIISDFGCRNYLCDYIVISVRGGRSSLDRGSKVSKLQQGSVQERPDGSVQGSAETSAQTCET